MNSWLIIITMVAMVNGTPAYTEFPTDRSLEAEECYGKALTLKSDHVDTNMNVGHMLRLQGRWEEAKEKYQVVLKRRPSFAIIRHHLGYVNEQLMLYKVNTPAMFIQVSC